MAAKNNCVKRDVCIFSKESFCKSSSECGHYIAEKVFTSTNTARNEIAVDLLRGVMARTLFSDKSKSAIVSEFQRQLSSVA